MTDLEMPDISLEKHLLILLITFLQPGNILTWSKQYTSKYRSHQDGEINEQIFVIDAYLVLVARVYVEKVAYLEPRQRSRSCCCQIVR